MKPSVVVAFLVGAALASGIVYMAVKPKPEAIISVASAPAVSREQPKPDVPPAPAPAPSPEIEKPSPVAPAPLVAQREQQPSVPKSHRQPPVQALAEVSHPVAERRLLNAAVQADLPITGLNTAAPPAPTPAFAPVLDPAPESVLRPEPAPAPTPPALVVNTVTLRPGVNLDVRIGETLTTKRNRVGDTFLATLTGPLVIDGWVIAERGARVEGRIVESDPGGRVQGTARLSVELVRLTTSDGQRIRIQTEPIDKKAKASGGEDAAKVGGGAALGAIIGAIAGGGKGAGIGAGVGGAAGAGDVLLTRGKPAEIAVESRLSFRVANPVEITERKNNY